LKQLTEVKEIDMNRHKLWTSKKGGLIASIGEAMRKNKPPASQGAREEPSMRSESGRRHASRLLLSTGSGQRLQMKKSPCMKNMVYHPARDMPRQGHRVRAGSHSSIYMSPLPAIVHIAFVIACAAAVSTVTQAFADGEVVRQVSASCALTSVTGIYKALSSDYRLAGSCSVNETSGGRTSAVPFYAINWTATASHQPNTKATFETMTLTLMESGRATSVGTVNSTMQCGTDPWRVAPSRPCRRVTRKTTPPSFPGYLSMAYEQLLQNAPGLPLSFSLTPAQRAALHKQYQIAMAAQQKVDPSQSTLSKPQGPGVGPFKPHGPKTSDAILSRQMPRILSPSSETTVGDGFLLVKILPPSIGAEPVSELEFTWLDTPAGQPRFVNTIPAMDTTKLTQGQYIDPKVTRLNYGRWEIRVRMIREGAVAGPWSAPALFTLVAAQPKQSIPKSAPASPFLKSPSERFGTGTTVIRPRGIDEKEAGRKPSEPVGTVEQTEKP
jgi:hypothetical protein